MRHVCVVRVCSYNYYVLHIKNLTGGPREQGTHQVFERAKTRVYAKRESAGRFGREKMVIWKDVFETDK